MGSYPTNSNQLVSSLGLTQQMSLDTAVLFKMTCVQQDDAEWYCSMFLYVGWCTCWSSYNALILRLHPKPLQVPVLNICILKCMLMVRVFLSIFCCKILSLFSLYTALKRFLTGGLPDRFGDSRGKNKLNYIIMHS